MRCLGAGTELTPPASGHGGGSLRLALDTEADHSASLWTRRRITPPRSGYGGGSLRLALDTEADHSASSPVRITKTSSSVAARRIASSGTAPFVAFSEPTIAIAGPAGRTVSPSLSARARASARRSGGP